MSKVRNRSLTGADVFTIRKALKETQEIFGERFDVSQPVIVRLEKKPDQEVSGPMKILILQVAEKHKISF